MIHIILAILKVIGIVLLVILGLILLLILTVLFCPVFYRIRFQKDAQTLEGQFRVMWLAGIIYIKGIYRDKDFDLNVRLLGIPLRVLGRFGRTLGRIIRRIVQIVPRRRTQPRAANEELIKPATKTPVTKTPATDASAPDDAAKPERLPETRKIPEADPPKEKISIWSRIKTIIRTIVDIPRRIYRFFKKIWLTIHTICGRMKQWKQFLTADSTKSALTFLLGRGKGILRHIRPRRVKGRLKYGFDDPALTGQLLAGLSVVYPLYKDKVTIVPVFDSVVFECDLDLKGRVIGCVLLKCAWDVYRNEHIKTTIRRFQHKEA